MISLSQQSLGQRIIPTKEGLAEIMVDLVPKARLINQYQGYLNSARRHLGAQHPDVVLGQRHLDTARRQWEIANGQLVAWFRENGSHPQLEGRWSLMGHRWEPLQLSAGEIWTLVVGTGLAIVAAVILWPVSALVGVIVGAWALMMTALGIMVQIVDRLNAAGVKGGTIGTAIGTTIGSGMVIAIVAAVVWIGWRFSGRQRA